uniref:Beta-lactamase n=2 Tax=Rubinisphaera brasiliensis TaxID=119 RepID=F0SGG5_RUBBR|nr:beta-lactamase [Rubinisphaera brasiliensis DSM 5305]
MIEFETRTKAPQATTDSKQSLTVDGKSEQRLYGENMIDNTLSIYPRVLLRAGSCYGSRCNMAVSRGTRKAFISVLVVALFAGMPADSTADDWSQTALANAKAFSETLDTAAVVIMQNGDVVDQWGDVSLPLNCHSTRKSILSALFGPHVEAGTIDLDATLKELGINDCEPSLTDEERTATIRDLLKARSGIYHPALYETTSMAAKRPQRGSHKPNTFWYYNNWDFNASCTIFENLTGRCIFEEFESRFAGPLGMQDFQRERDTRYVTGDDSVHPAYPFRMSARDMAKFGQLMLQGGKWQEEQLVPESWVRESTQSYSNAGPSGGYGYMWWVGVDGVHFPGMTLPEGTYSARGSRGQYLVIIPEWNIVVCHRVNSSEDGMKVSRSEFARLLAMILEARPEKNES